MLFYLTYIILGYSLFVDTLLCCDSKRRAKERNGKEANCAGLKLVAIPVNLPDDVTFLNLRDNYLTQVTSDDLPYPILRALDLSFNNITALPAGTFRQLVQLEMLDLRFNHLTYDSRSMPPGMLRGLSKLIELKLTQCNSDIKRSYPTFPIGIYQHVVNLQQLTIGCLGTEILEIPSEVASLPSLHTLSISRPGIPNIGNDSFRLLQNSSVHTLLLGNIHHPHIDPNALVHLRNLSTLRVSGPAEHIREMMASLGDSTLTTLVLDLSYVSTLPTDLFCNGVGDQLEHLSLLHYTGHYLDVSMFNCTKSLKRLSIRYSLFKLLDMGHRAKIRALLKYLPASIKVLELTTRFSTTEDFRTKVEFCTRTNQKPCDIDTDSFFPTPLSVLNEDYFQETESNDTFNMNGNASVSPVLPSLEYLSLKIEGVGSCEKSLSIGANNIRAMDVAYFVGLASCGRLESQTPPISGSYKLEYLDFSHIGFKSLPLLMDLHRLRILNISHNKLGYYEGDTGKRWTLTDEFFWAVPHLEVLDLSSNSLTSLPGDLIECHPRLKSLFLSGNRLNSDLFFTLPHQSELNVINLAANEFNHLTQRFLTQIEHLKSSKKVAIDLSDNPFQCQCELKPLSQWLQESSLDITNKEIYVCSQLNQPLQHTTILELNFNHVCPVGNLLIASLTAVTILAIFLVAIAIAIKHKMRLRLLYYILKWKLRPKAVPQGDYLYDVFVLYNNDSDSDRKFVAMDLRQLLEENEHADFQYNMFIWDRNMPGGGSTADDIINGMQLSKRIMIIHSDELFEVDYTFTLEGNTPGRQSMPLLNLTDDNDTDVLQPADSLSTKCGVKCNEWVDFSLLACVRLMMSKPIVVVRRGDVDHTPTPRQHHVLLFHSPIICAEDRNFTIQLNNFHAATQRN